MCVLYGCVHDPVVQAGVYVMVEGVGEPARCVHGAGVRTAQCASAMRVLSSCKVSCKVPCKVSAPAGAASTAV
jgi:hypothetical protein